MIRSGWIVLLILFSFASDAQENISLYAKYPYDQGLMDIWGYADTSGEYAIVGLRKGVSIVDISDPRNPEELFFIGGVNSKWRDIKTWNNHAYVVHDNFSGPDSLADALLIVNLSELPGSIDTTHWHGGSFQFKEAHNIFIDENGYAYLFGYNTQNGISPDKQGALILDLNADPEDPVRVGSYNTGYIHDGFVRNDTLWASEFNNGYFSVIDVTDKSNPNILATRQTSNRGTHNCWLSSDGNTLYTTDEVAGAYVESYDVSDLNNISLLDQYREDPGKSVYPHNTFMHNGFLVTSYYTNGVIILDGNRPGNLVKVGHFDTSPIEPSAKFAGCWGVYPYFPSGTIVASDIEEGLYVLKPEYKRATYLEGRVYDSINKFAITGAEIALIGTEGTATTDISGSYKAGLAEPGTYRLAVSADGFQDTIIENVQLKRSEVTIKNIALLPPEKDLSFRFFAQPNFYPNDDNSPVTIFFRLGDFPVKGAEINVFDISGRIIQTIEPAVKIGDFKLDESLSPGMYFAKFSGNGFEEIIKFVIRSRKIN